MTIVSVLLLYHIIVDLDSSPTRVMRALQFSLPAILPFC